MLLFPSIAWAEQFSLLRPSGAKVTPFIARSVLTTAQKNGSLFSGNSARSFFAHMDRPSTESHTLGLNITKAAMVRHLIGRAEAGKMGYDAIQYSAKILPDKLPTQMTIGEIFDWIADTPNQNHAIGKYQFIPKTLKRLVNRKSVPLNTVFSPRLQDQLADMLLVEAGLLEFESREIERVEFMNNIAKIWAGLPTSNGRSYYDGFAGNKATMAWKEFDQEMKRIFNG
ncbi:hypothetical protein ACFE33_08865 [Falsihalocynthiibacter sp. SS001]|uniref:hypothetical protein n=1 Tax=Falsihalocynthiibacter sp. SS001 TaxID=3349698 RepID=UPI0036D2BDB6